MKLHEAINRQLIQPSSSLPARILSVCNVCRSLEDCGDHDGAWELLAELLPVTEDLEPGSKAELMLRHGVLSGWLGVRDQVEGAQEKAKDLISGSIELFRQAGNRSREAEGFVMLAACYHRQALLENARACVQSALGLIEKIEEEELKCRALIRLAFVERDAGRLHEALRIHRDLQPMVEACANDALKGMYHTEYALVLRRVAAAENKPELYDEALIQYSGASFHYERAENLRYQIAVENNQGFLLMKLKRFAGAHAHVDRSLEIALRLNDKEFAAQALDTRAQIFIAQGRFDEAVLAARKSVELLKNGEQKGLLVASLTTYGVALAKTGDNFRAQTTLEKAISLADETDDYTGFINTSVALLQEIGPLSPQRQADVYLDALERAGKLQDAELFAKLSEAGGSVLRRRAAVSAEAPELTLPAEWAGMPFESVMESVEGALIRQALTASHGSVRAASKLLGLKKHQTLFAMLKRHPELDSLKANRRRAGSAGHESKPSIAPRPGDMKRIGIHKNWLAGLGIFAGSVVLAFTADVQPGDLVAVTTVEGENAVGAYRVEAGRVFLDVFSMEYEPFEFERVKVKEIRKVYAWHPEDDPSDVHVL